MLWAKDQGDQSSVLDLEGLSAFRGAGNSHHGADSARDHGFGFKSESHVLYHSSSNTNNDTTANLMFAASFALLHLLIACGPAVGEYNLIVSTD